MTEKGFLLISDITGYTSFLTKSELDHAQHILDELFKCQLRVLMPPLKVSNFQGDAILCYAPDHSPDTGDKTFQQAIDLYKVFREKIAEMLVNPPCECTACSTINLLDLKIFVHYGDFLVKKIGDSEELLGADVILAHRMMKNKVKEKTKIKSYLLMTEAAFSELYFSDKAIDLTPYDDFFEYIGKVSMKVADLNKCVN